MRVPHSNTRVDTQSDSFLEQRLPATSNWWSHVTSHEDSLGARLTHGEDPADRSVAVRQAMRAVESLSPGQARATLRVIVRVLVETEQDAVTAGAARAAVEARTHQRLWSLICGWRFR